MKSVLISIQPKWCELIASGKKTIEVRKTKPKLETPFKCYIYCTKNTFNIRYSDSAKDWQKNACGKVIGEFLCDYIEDFKEFEYGIDVLHRHIKLNACINYGEIYDYLGFKKCGYGWHISNLVIYDKPRELSEFVVEGDCLNGDCKKCKWFDGGNNYNVEADCLLPYDFHFNKSVKPLFRPPQSWCYVESEVERK